MPNNISHQNLADALLHAIRHRGHLEKAMGYEEDSELLAGWKENIRRAKGGEKIMIEKDQ